MSTYVAINDVFKAVCQIRSKRSLKCHKDRSKQHQAIVVILANAKIEQRRWLIEYNKLF